MPHQASHARSGAAETRGRGESGASGHAPAPVETVRGPSTSPTRIVVLYDDRCAFCVRCAEWLASEPALVAVELLPCGSERARLRFGEVPGLGDDLLVVADTGDAWSGPGAFVVCLWALARWRPYAFLLAAPELAWLSRRFFTQVARRRHWLASMMGHAPCHDGACLAPAPGGPYR